MGVVRDRLPVGNDPQLAGHSQVNHEKELAIEGQDDPFAAAAKRANAAADQLFLPLPLPRPP